MRRLVVCVFAALIIDVLIVLAMVTCLSCDEAYALGLERPGTIAQQKDAIAESKATAAVAQHAIDTKARADRIAAERQAKIDAVNDYLGSSPLGGYGSEFVDAAAEYGIDYRLLPAISCIESGKGRDCFKSHNAWGWGNSSWGSWPEAIWAISAGIKRVYGNQSPLNMSAKYCTSNDNWGCEVLNEMNKI